MRLTSVQRSGPDGHVARFIRTKPFPLAYRTIRNRRDAESFIATAIRKAGGICFPGRIVEHLAANLERLENGEWPRSLQQSDRLTQPASRAVEKEVAGYIQATFDGFGPKQSRNPLKALGLIRFEIPISSRVTGWLNEFGFPVRLSAAALADRKYYEFVSSGIQALCEECGVFPCVLDAAIFASIDGDGWTITNVH